MNEITKVLNPDEKVLWSGNPKKAPFLFSFALLGLFFGAIIYFSGLSYSISKPEYYILFSFLAILAFALFFFVGYLYYRVTYYAITDRRVILQSGIFGRSYKSIDFDKIQNVSVVIGLFNYIFRTGTIKIFSGEIGSSGGNNAGVQPIFDQIVFIQNPDSTLRILQEALSHKKEAVVDVLENINTKIPDNNGKV